MCWKWVELPRNGGQFRASADRFLIWTIGVDVGAFSQIRPAVLFKHAPLVGDQQALPSQSCAGTQWVPPKRQATQMANQGDGGKFYERYAGDRRDVV